MFLFVPCGVAD